MRVLVVGSHGNMGSRYVSILKYLGHECLHFDHPWDASLGQVIESSEPDAIIVATPTQQHTMNLTEIAQATSCPVLCEKPIATRNIDDLDMDNLYMVNQYQYLRVVQNPGTITGETTYNNFSSGKDGRAWDCIQLIHLAKGVIDIDGTSPHWKLTLNGHGVGKYEIDDIYVKMIHDFLGPKSYCWDLDTAKKAHRKVEAYIARK